MTLVRFSPLSELETVQAQMNHLLDEVTNWQGDEKTFWRPSVELVDSDKNLILKASLPGISKDNIEIHLTREKVKLAGQYDYKKQEEELGVYHSEFRYGKFERAIALPVAIDHENVIADFVDGILTLTLPKAIPTSKKVIKLSLTDTETKEDLWSSETSELS